MAQRGPIVVLGASGAIGRAVAAELLAQGAAIRCPLRRVPVDPFENPNAHVEIGDMRNRDMQERVLEGASGVISCLASRTGVPKDAWAVEYELNKAWLDAALAAQIPQFVLLSALCVQRPELAFQRAKLAFEAHLHAAPVNWTIVRPTAFFRSLSGQVDRLRLGKPFLVFGSGCLTACKPISDRDLARYLVACLDNPQRANRVLPIGGPGPAQTPLQQGAALAAALDLPFRVRHVPVSVLNVIIAGLSLAGLVNRTARDKAELARIGRHYATRSMLLWDPATQTYCDQATPETGNDRLEEYFRALAAGEVVLERGEHAVF